MTKEERELAIDIFEDNFTVIDTHGHYTEEEECLAIDMAIEALKQEPCEDAISRQAVRHILNHEVKIPIKVWKKLFELVDCLPSVNPQEPKTGHWEYVQYDYNPRLGNWHCSECRCVVIECVDKNEKGGIPLYKYCPQCGAKMVESQESEE